MNVTADDVLRPVVAVAQRMVEWYAALPLVTRHAIYNHLHAADRHRSRLVTRRKQRAHRA